MTIRRNDRKKALALLRDSSLWAGKDKRELLGNLHYYCMLLGEKWSREFRDEISPFYWHVAERTTVAERLDLLMRLGELAEQRVIGLGALDPFLSDDEEPAVVSTTALKFAVLIPPENGDPLYGPKEVFKLTEGADTDATYAGILQGLLLLGDRRVLPLLDRCWEPLGEEGRRILIHSWSGFVYASTIDFLLGWLECEKDESLYGSIAGTLAGYPLRGDAYPFVLDLERKFPANGEEEGPSVKVVGKWAFREYGAIIAPRMKALAAAESGEKVISKTMAAWRIK